MNASNLDEKRSDSVLLKVLTDRDGAIKLPIDNGSSECIGFEVRAFGFEAGENLFGGVDLTIRADADAECTLGGDDIADPVSTIYGPAEGLINYWPLDDVQSGTVDDIIGDSNGTATDVSTINGLVRQAASFSQGSNIVVSHDGSLTDLSDFTASAWFKSTADEKRDQVIFGIKRGYELVFDSAGSRTSSDNSVWWAVDNGTGDWDVNDTGSDSLDLNNWHHTALVQDTDADEIRIYINGSRVTSDSGTGPVNPSENDFAIGSRGDGFGQLIGNVDEVRIYDRALSDDRVQKLYETTGGN